MVKKASARRPAAAGLTAAVLSSRVCPRNAAQVAGFSAGPASSRGTSCSCPRDNSPVGAGSSMTAQSRRPSPTRVTSCDTSAVCTLTRPTSRNAEVRSKAMPGGTEGASPTRTSAPASVMAWAMLCSSVASRTRIRACGSRDRPASVRVAPVAERRIRSRPRFDSRRFSPWDTGDWVSLSRSAAPVTLPSSATATKYSQCRREFGRVVMCPEPSGGDSDELSEVRGTRAHRACRAADCRGGSNSGEDAYDSRTGTVPGQGRDPFSHGTRTDLCEGESANFSYLTATLDASIRGAGPAVGEWPGRIHRVEPRSPSRTTPT